MADEYNAKHPNVARVHREKISPISSMINANANPNRLKAKLSNSPINFDSFFILVIDSWSTLTLKNLATGGPTSAMTATAVPTHSASHVFALSHSI